MAPAAPIWPLDNLPHLHISGAEPRIFPGVVTRRARRQSLRAGAAGVAEREHDGVDGGGYERDGGEGVGDEAGHAADGGERGEK